MRKFLLEKLVIHFNAEELEEFKKYLRQHSFIYDFSIDDAQDFILDTIGPYKPAESKIIYHKPAALQAFAETSCSASGGVDSLDLTGYMLLEDYRGGYLDYVDEHRFKGADNPFYVIACTNNQENNVERCQDLLEEWKNPIDEEQDGSEWVQLINKYNEAHGTNETPEDAPLSAIAKWTQEQNYFSFEF